MRRTGTSSLSLCVFLMTSIGLLSGSGCAKRIHLAKSHPPTVILETAIAPAPSQLVHPVRNEAGRELWSTLPDEGPYVVLRLAFQEDLQALVNRKGGYTARYFAHPCANKPSIDDSLATGPVFRSSIGQQYEDDRHGGAWWYEVYIPKDLKKAVEAHRNTETDLELQARLQAAVRGGVCIVVLEVRPYGGGFVSGSIRIPVVVQNGQVARAER